MADYIITSDFRKVFDTVQIALVLTDCDLNLIHVNRFARASLPLNLEPGKRLEVGAFLQSEDSVAFEKMLSECRENGESISILKEKGVDKYYKVKAYHLKNKNGEIVFHFEDVSQSRILENQLYDHLIDLYNQLETQEREITNLRAVTLRSKDVGTRS